MNISQPLKSVIAAGGVVYRQSSIGMIELLLVGKKNSGEWRLPKGMQNADPETLEETALREVREETGLIVSIEDYLCSSRWSYTFGNETIDKTIAWFILIIVGGDISNHDTEYDTLKWMLLKDAINELTYKNEIDVLNKAIEYFNNKSKHY